MVCELLSEASHIALGVDPHLPLILNLYGELVIGLLQHPELFVISSEPIALTLKNIVFLFQAFYDRLHFPDIDVDLGYGFVFGLELNGSVREIVFKFAYGLLQTGNKLLLFDFVLLQSVIFLVCHL